VPTNYLETESKTMFRKLQVENPVKISFMSRDTCWKSEGILWADTFSELHPTK
jgi:hypothetical protein